MARKFFNCVTFALTLGPWRDNMFSMKLVALVDRRDGLYEMSRHMLGFTRGL